jgi:aromatic ring-cleaving dioxygenase
MNISIFLFLTYLLRASGHVQFGIPVRTEDECAERIYDNPNLLPDIANYHIHILFLPNVNSTAAAKVLVNDISLEFLNVPADTTKMCNFSPGDFKPNFQQICQFETRTSPAGPFATGQGSFFVPTEYIEKISRFAVQRRRSLDILIHPNSGCTVVDHSHWGYWSGQKWPLDLGKLIY